MKDMQNWVFAGIVILVIVALIFVNPSPTGRVIYTSSDTTPTPADDTPASPPATPTPKQVQVASNIMSVQSSGSSSIQIGEGQNKVSIVTSAPDLVPDVWPMQLASDQTKTYCPPGQNPADQCYTYKLRTSLTYAVPVVWNKGDKPVFGSVTWSLKPVVFYNGDRIQNSAQIVSGVIEFTQANPLMPGDSYVVKDALGKELLQVVGPKSMWEVKLDTGVTELNPNNNKALVTLP